jgi:hypothetical protein
VQVVVQTLDEILGSLRPLTVSWQDDVATRVIDRLKALPVTATYGEGDVRQILETGKFEDGLLIVRLFLGLSKDPFTTALVDALGPRERGHSL